MAYAAAVYLFFLAVLGYAAAFFAGFLVLKGIDQGTRAAVVAVDLLLLLLFAGQHTVMARPWSKRRWTRVVPGSGERAGFVLAASLVLALLFWPWQPVGQDRLKLPGPGVGALRGVYTAGWALAVISILAGKEKKKDSLGSRRYETQDGNHPGGRTSAGRRPRGCLRPGWPVRAVAVVRGHDRGRRAGRRPTAGPRPEGQAGGAA